MRRWISITVRLLAFLLAAGFANGQSGQVEVQPEVQLQAQAAPLNVGDIMAQVAANQDRSEAVRTEYTYKQHIHIFTHHSERVMREEKADYEVVLLPDGRAQKQLKSLTGRYWDKDKYVEIRGEPVSYAGSTNPDPVHNLRNHENLPEASRTDEGLIRNLRNHLSDDTARDGLARDLFPLTSEEQKGYEFKFIGQEVEAGRNVYHIAFTPKGKEPTWAGEAFIDTAEFQPVRVFTKMSQRLPFLVRTMWFDLPGIGFNVVYNRQEDGVWFPTSFGTEFSLHVGPMFFFNRDVSISLDNSGFEHPPVENK